MSHKSIQKKPMIKKSENNLNQVKEQGMKNFAGAFLF